MMQPTKPVRRNAGESAIAKHRSTVPATSSKPKAKLRSAKKEWPGITEDWILFLLELNRQAAAQAALATCAR
jgi:hypothetical protein